MMKKKRPMKVVQLLELVVKQSSRCSNHFQLSQLFSFLMNEEFYSTKKTTKN